MELHQIECFLELSKFQNMSLTADKLNISQPALSKSISLLESELGVKLFDRVGRRICLNEHGKLFAHYAEESLKTLYTGKKSVKDLKYEPTGILSIALFSYINLLADCLHEFIRKYPLVRFELYSSKSQYTIDNFSSIDFTLSSALSDNQQKQEFLTSTIPISSEEYVIVAAPELLAEYNIKPAERVTLASLHRLPFIAMADNLMFSDITYSFCLQAGFTPWLVLETNDFATKLHMSALGTAAAFIPEICIADFKALRDDFCFLYLSDINTRRTIRLGRKRSSETSPLAQTFWDFACNYYSRSAIP